MASMVGKPLAINLGGVKRNAVIVEPQMKSEHDRTTVLVDNTQDVRCKRRINFQYSGMQPASVARRNARERNRVKQVNNGFATLRNHIPLSVAAALGASTPNTGRGQSKKLSKVETLRLAVEYIRSLQDMLDESGGGQENYYREEIKMEMSPLSDTSSNSPPPSSASYQSEPSYNSGSYPNENYEPMSPEDEELLDVISWWQQAQ